MSDDRSSDELAQLRGADPVAASTLPSPHHPHARDLFATIIKGGSAQSGAAQTQRGGIDARRRLVLAAAAVVAAAIVGGVALLGGAGDPRDSDIVGADPTAEATTGAISPGGTSLGSCVEVYDLQTLAQRETAFDGTVAQVAGDKVTFTVNEWYRGGEDGEITLAGASALNGITSAGPGATLEPGTRLLVAGDGGFAWSCGFTQPYDPAVAREWKSALTG